MAARRFGDDYPAACNLWRIRIACMLLWAATLFYVPWMLRSLNPALPWLAWPFAVANTFSMISWWVTAFNAWSRHVPAPRPVPAGDEPTVAVIIPTCGEPIPMVLRTVTSVLEQDWPADRLVVVVSDDGHDARLQEALAAYPVTYHSPPPRFAPGRDGAAKAGNLNSVMAWLAEARPDIEFIETRDADDDLGSTRFLRLVLGQLMADESLAYVQTIKEAEVSPGDPFNNRDATFYRGQMLARNAANAVFPCGSGVVWRRVALVDIGGFPTWNLVEDLQSGVEALRRGWRSMYLPIVGAVGQHSPEDVPNVYKQRGTWAIDTVRLLLWGDLKGLGFRQRMHFVELLMFYVHSFTTLVYVPAVAFTLLGLLPIDDRAFPYFLHMVPMVLANELLLLALAQPYNDRRGRQRRQWRALWRVRAMWVGLAPVFMIACVRAVLGGPRKKPVYKVTRKVHDVRWHWREILPQACALALVAGVTVWAVTRDTLPSPAALLGGVYWGGFNIALFATFVARSWHGLGRPTAGFKRERRSGAEGVVPLPAPPLLADPPSVVGVAGASGVSGVAGALPPSGAVPDASSAVVELGADGVAGGVGEGALADERPSRRAGDVVRPAAFSTTPVHLAPVEVSVLVDAIRSEAARSEAALAEVAPTMLGFAAPPAAEADVATPSDPPLPLAG